MGQEGACNEHVHFLASGAMRNCSEINGETKTDATPAFKGFCNGNARCKVRGAEANFKCLMV